MREPFCSFSYVVIGRNGSIIHENYSRDLYYDAERGGTRRHNVKKSWKIGRPILLWSKDPLRCMKNGGGEGAGLLFFATLSSPTGREYTQRRPVSEQTALEIRHGRKSFWKKKDERGRVSVSVRERKTEKTRASRRNERHTSLVHYFRAPSS